MNWVPGWPKFLARAATCKFRKRAHRALSSVFDGVSYRMVVNSGVDNVRAGYATRAIP